LCLLTVLSLFLVINSSVTAQTASWAIVDGNFATIAMSNSFQTDESGWIAGGTASLEPLVINTPDAGKTLNNVGVENVTEGAFMSIRMANGQAGVAGALGFLGLICGAYTNDGTTWHKSHEGFDIVCAAQGAAAPDPQTFIMIGQWTSGKEPNGDGVQISTDGGSTWTGQDWKQGTTSRYGSFISKDLGYVTGGSWPDEASSSKFSFPYKFNRHLEFDGKKVRRVNHQRRHPTPNNIHSQGIVPPGYQGVLALATSEASTWQTLINATNQGFYFNQISCLDQNNCWVTAEGNNITNGLVAAWIFATTDGWKTTTTQLYYEGGSLVAIEMISPTFGWASGAYVGQEGSEEALKGAFFQTTDGQTWQQAGSLNDFYAMDLSVIDQNNAFASGVTEFGLSSLARYSVPSK